MISKSFEIKDYAIDDSQINGFWMTLLDRETLTTEIIYSPVKGDSFDVAQTNRMIGEITEKCDHFSSLLPENISCQVTFSDLGDLKYVAGSADLVLESGEMDEIRVVYRLHVEYHI
ncbi:hypothetical protein [Methanococcoides sp. FTZ1]|uniref:hypothetical protein n=1 Tax=Methanococcoides sp. FTZ1 TaxID=3439061 RepID=UPI003F82B6EA